MCDTNIHSFTCSIRIRFFFFAFRFYIILNNIFPFIRCGCHLHSVINQSGNVLWHFRLTVAQINHEEKVWEIGVSLWYLRHLPCHSNEYSTHYVKGDLSVRFTCTIYTLYTVHGTLYISYTSFSEIEFKWKYFPNFKTV